MATAVRAVECVTGRTLRRLASGVVRAFTEIGESPDDWW
jgi:hypothetical protein